MAEIRTLRDAVAELIHPSGAAGYTVRDDGFYQAWDAISRDRERFTAWLRDHVLDAAGTPAR